MSFLAHISRPNKYIGRICALILFISISTTTSGQHIDENGTLVIPDSCSEQVIAEFLNTTPDIARDILMQSRQCLIANEGLPVIQKPQSCIGKLIFLCSGNGLSSFFFCNYWTGGGDIRLSGRQFADILLCIKQNTAQMEFPAAGDSIRQQTFSFYNTRYGKAFGVATIYLDSENRIVGFRDVYDFDPKKCGVRPLKYEIYVRLVSLLSPDSASKFVIYYGDKELVP